jgi:CRP-like cAMP-binding protein
VVGQKTALGQTNRLLDGLRPDEWERLRPYLRRAKLHHGADLYHARNVIKRVFFPLSGMVSLLATMHSGDMIETGIIGREGVVGASVAQGNERSFAQATVQIAGEALTMDSASFINEYRANTGMRDIVRRYQWSMLAQAQQSAACHALHSVEARFARWLLQAQDTLGTSTINLTQDFLSHMLGVRRTSVSLVANTMLQAGLIKYSRGRLQILDGSRLREHACECYAVIRAEIERVLPPSSEAAGRERADEVVES